MEKNINNLNKTFDNQRNKNICRKILWRRIINTVFIILALAFLLFMPLEAAHMKESEYVLLDLQHNMDHNGYCEIHALARHATFDSKILNTVSKITTRHQVKYNEPYKHSSIIYIYRNIFDYMEQKPFEIYFQYSDSQFMHKYPNEKSFKTISL